MTVGVKFVFKNKLVLSALSLDLFAVLFGGAVALVPSFTDKILHLGPEAYGLLRTAPAVGAVLMAFYMAVKPPAKNAGISLLLGVAAFGLFTIFFAFSTNYWLAFAMLLFTGAFDNISVVVRHSILQLSTPDEMRGRVAAVNSIFIGSSNEIGAFRIGSSSSLVGFGAIYCFWWSDDNFGGVRSTQIESKIERVRYYEVGIMETHLKEVKAAIG
jgi:MFS family permease